MTSAPIAYPGPLAKGARDTSPSGPVHRLQGWLALHGYDPGPVDGDFGPRTEAALKHFRVQLTSRLQPMDEMSGVLSQIAWAALTAPLARAMGPIPPSACVRSDGTPIPLGNAVAFVASQWLTQRVGGGPMRELPGNSGPVVEHCTRWLAERDGLNCVCSHIRKRHVAGTRRMVCTDRTCDCEAYTPDWRLPWCAGWVSTVLRQAADSLSVPIPIAGSLSCDVLARQAKKEAGLLWTQLRGVEWWRRDMANGHNEISDAVSFLRPGDLFLVRGKAPGDWVHCGVVLGAKSTEKGTWLNTAEGNTNEDGRRNGTLLLERWRQAERLDFICWVGS